MTALLLSILLLSGSYSIASTHSTELVATGTNGSVRLLQEKCGATVLPLLRPEYHDQFSRAVIHTGIKRIEACWTIQANGGIYIHDEENDRAVLPMSVFKVSPGT